jgi:hypothetical protein
VVEIPQYDNHIKNIGVPYTLADISKAPSSFALGGFCFGRKLLVTSLRQIIPVVNLVCQVRILHSDPKLLQRQQI